MAISPMDLERALEGVNELALPVLAASFLYQAVSHAARPAVPHRRGPSGCDVSRGRCSLKVRRAVSLLGLVVSLGSPAAAAERPLLRRRPASPLETSSLRSEPGRLPPPRLPGPAEPPPAGGIGREGTALPVREGAPPPPWATERASHDPGVPTDPSPEAAARGAVHPAVHAGRSGEATRLFPRSGMPSATSPTTGATTRDRLPRARAQWHAVLPGETLWSIAAERLGTDDIRRIARYWPRIHRANRDEIGPNPSLIRPGQVLELPPERS